MDLLLIGPATRDLLREGGWRLGGTVLYAALAATRLGLRVGVLTCGPADVVAALRAALPEAQVAARPCQQVTTYENVYDASGARHQYLRARGGVLGAEDVPPAWREAGHVLLAPLAQDVDPTIIQAFPARTRLAATAQGWLRQWDAAGLVSPGVWTDSATVLPRIAALILSDEDLLGGASAQTQQARAAAEADDRLEGDAQLLAWRASGARVVVTQGERGASLFTRTGREHFPALAVRAVDPTGAGDVFAAALLRAWWWGDVVGGDAHGDLGAALRFANAAASFAVERVGTAGIPRYDDVLARLRGEETGTASV